MIMIMSKWKLIDGKKPYFLCPEHHDGFLWGMDSGQPARKFFRILEGELSREYNIPIPVWLQNEIIEENNRQIPMEEKETKYEEKNKGKETAIEEKTLLTDQEKADKALLDIQEKKPYTPKVEYDSKLEKELVGIIPDRLTKGVYEKWAVLTIPERLLMLLQTSQKDIQTRKGRGGSYKYVDIGYMLKCANMAFGFAWSSQVEKFQQTETEIICFGSVMAMGETKYAIGQQDIAFKSGTKEPVCLGDNYKAAQSDMMKKALSQFGIASDVYNNEV